VGVEPKSRKSDHTVAVKTLPATLPIGSSSEDLLKMNLALFEILKK